MYDNLNTRGQLYEGWIVLSNRTQLFQLRLSPEQSGKVEYERERLLGIANKFIHLLANPSSLSHSYSTFPLCSGDNLNLNSCSDFFNLCKMLEKL
jgi:hypothetical protein